METFELGTGHRRDHDRCSVPALQLRQLVAKLPWSHNVRVLDRIKDRPTRERYLRAALEYGWSRDVLVLQIKSRLHEREGKALTNFPRALPIDDSKV
jgi:hypothetical protein